MTDRQRFSRMRVIPLAFLASLCAFALWAATAQGAGITGISDENLDSWSQTTWSAFAATGVKQVRDIIPWNIAEPGHGEELKHAEAWVKAASEHHLEIVISFDHPALPCDRSLATCEFPKADLPPSAAEYLNAVAKFRENPQFTGITSYTAWNEPNHHVAPVKHPEQDMNPASFPNLAGEYWVNLNFVCHTAKYGPPCTVAGGDFLEGATAESLENYFKSYKTTIAESHVSPSAWAIHPYTAAETGSWSVIDGGFMPLTESKPVWLTEAGGMVCKTGSGYTAADHTLASSLAVQNGQASNLLALINHEGTRVQRSYYYSFAAANGGEPACTSPSYVFDSTIFANNAPRPALWTLFPQTKGIWWGLRNSNSSGIADTVLIFGSGNKPLAGDWNGDGVDSPGAFTNIGNWFLRNSNTSGEAESIFAFGASGDAPVVGDWNNDGIDTIGVFRSSAISWFLRNSNSSGAADLTFSYGVSGYTPVTGDWNGDGTDTIGIFKEGLWYLRNSNSTGVADIPAFAFGAAGDIPVVGDWNGDGIDTIGVFRPSTAQWFLRNSNNGGANDYAFSYGNPGDTPVVGDWNHDGIDTPGVVR
jgi:hypothetical protein